MNLPAIVQKAALTVPNTQVVQYLPPTDRKIVQAALQPQIRQLQPGIVLNDLITILTSIYTIAGQKSEPQTLALYAEAFYVKLAESFPMITLEEIKTALTKGVFDEYGEYFGLNVKSFVFFVRSYLESATRKLAFEQHDKIKARLQEYRPTPQEVAEITKQYINELYCDYLNGKLRVDFIPAHYYDYLLSLGLVSPVLDRTRALLHYTTNIETNKLRFIRPEHINEEDASKESALHSIARRFAIVDMFRKLKLNEKESAFN
ncbi:hypothetical protein [Foetidibacter luteolus]|uniref:hypothetical protein n=1 Tax=Foetidibacter luteolus TaxID=2608880 RepID=UPI00129B9E62|nr:hypothetical protein [Foetidibacter luteolus]